MQLLTQMKQKTMLILILATCILCLAFIFISCGTDPQLKITDPETGQSAIDFSTCTGNYCSGLLPSLSFFNDPDKLIADKDITIEAWVKSQADSPNDFTGGIFSRFDSAGGIALYAKEGKVKAAIRRVGGTGSATFTADYIVTSLNDLAKNIWTHIAAVLTSSDHNGIHDDCENRTDDIDCTDAGITCNDRLHLDLYTNGQYTDCNTTYGFNKIIVAELKKDLATAPDFAHEPGDKIAAVGVLAENLPQQLEGIGATVFLPGAVDEARLWGVARTPTQINACMNRELSNDNGTCGRSRDDLISYLRLNEGKGDTFNDWVGLGAGSLFGAGLVPFVEGWVPGAPLTKHD